MPTVIDSLVVTLGLDDAAYLKGKARKRDADKRSDADDEKFARDDDGRRKKQAESFKKVQVAAGEMLAVFTAGKGLKDFIQDTIASDAATGRLAANLGITTEALSTWQGVVTSLGGSSKDADQSIQALVTSFQNIQLTGTDKSIPILTRLGISPSDLKSPTDTLLKLADAVQGMSKPQATALLSGLGITPSTINLLEKGRTNVQALLNEQKKLGVTTEADAKADEEMQKTLANLTSASSRLGKTLLTAAAPALIMMAQGLTKVAIWAQSHGDIVIAVFAGLAAVAATLAVSAAAAALPFIAVAAGIGVAVAAVVLLVEWIGKLVDKYNLLHGWHFDWKHGLTHDASAPRTSAPSSAAPAATPPPASGLGTAWAAARATEAKYGVPALVTMAQYGLESGFGRHLPTGSNNPFGIKARAGEDYVEAMTTEHIHGRDVRVMARFRKFASLAEAFDAHGALLAHGRAYSAARSHTGDANAYADALTGHYATDPRYGAKLRANIARLQGGSRTDVRIAKLDVHTRATDAPGIARDLGGAIKRHAFVPQAATGLA